MSKAYCCDRCGTCFTPEQFDNVDTKMVTIEHTYWQDKDDIYNSTVSMRKDEIHLCPECAEMFSSFMCGYEFVDKKLFDDLIDDYENLIKETEKKNEKEDAESDLVLSLNRYIDSVLRPGGDCDGDKPAPLCDSVPPKRTRKSKKDSAD